MRARLVLMNVLAVAACALVYELLLGTLASYTLGDTVREFSITIGLYLAAMGAGAFVSGKIASREAERYIEAELLLAVLGGASAPLLFSSHATGGTLRAMVYGAVVILGALVGLELPLLLRMLKKEDTFANALSRALAFDYAGALVASIAFPMILVPHLGIVRASLATGLVNAVIALSATWVLAPVMQKKSYTRVLRAAGAAVACGLAFALFRVGNAEIWAVE